MPQMNECMCGLTRIPANSTLKKSENRFEKKMIFNLVEVYSAPLDKGLISILRFRFVSFKSLIQFEDDEILFIE